MARIGNFTAPIIREISHRAGCHCSNPSCRRLTYGPKESSRGSVNLGVAAHITAASVKGPRFDKQQTEIDRKSPNNGIWLCQQCSVLIDKDPDAYPVDTLIDWKARAEKAALKGTQNPGTFASGEANSDVVGFVLRYLKPSQYWKYKDLPAPPGHRYRESLKFGELGNKKNRIIHNPMLPICLSASFGPYPDSCLFMLSLENKGTGVEPHASLQISMQNAPIWKLETTSNDRINLLTTVKQGGRVGIAGFSVKDFMPGEHFALSVFSTSAGPFNVDQYTYSRNEHSIPFLADMKFGKPQIAKFAPDDPQYDPKFERAHYPFG
ncbi:hypothetical protein [Paraglaciecola psychrophila]|jgi:hypothetical protein|nr:hypothetical protein [Paraglaciecola psychrophila]GAC36635.1 hypothetical protein GPSY_0997 [Paraglaciecola psychrophila 170]